MLLLFSAFALAQTSKTTKKLPKGFTADAPKEMLQFSFLVGEFECTFKGLVNNKGDYNISTGHKWIGYYTLGGFGFQDDWYSNGSTYRGTTWRTYDPAKKRWVNKWLQAGTDNPAGFSKDYFFGNMKNGEMMIKATGKDQNGDYIDQIFFYNMSSKGFKWRMNRSYDGGKTWIKNMRMVDAVRVK